jgi:hypothetical protein
MWGTRLATYRKKGTCNKVTRDEKKAKMHKDHWLSAVYNTNCKSTSMYKNCVTVFLEQLDRYGRYISKQMEGDKLELVGKPRENH